MVAPYQGRTIPRGRRISSSFNIFSVSYYNTPCDTLLKVFCKHLLNCVACRHKTAANWKRYSSKLP